MRTDVPAATIPVQSDFTTVKSALIILCFLLDKRFPKTATNAKLAQLRQLITDRKMT